KYQSYNCPPLFATEDASPTSINRKGQTTHGENHSSVRQHPFRVTSSTNSLASPARFSPTLGGRSFNDACPSSGSLPFLTVNCERYDRGNPAIGHSGVTAWRVLHCIHKPCASNPATRTGANFLRRTVARGRLTMKDTISHTTSPASKAIAADRINTDAARNSPHAFAQRPQRLFAASKRAARSNPNMAVKKYGKSARTARVENAKISGDELRSIQIPPATARPCSRRKSPYVATKPIP